MPLCPCSGCTQAGPALPNAWLALSAARVLLKVPLASRGDAAPAPRPYRTKPHCAWAETHFHARTCWSFKCWQRSREALFTLGTRLDYRTILLCDKCNKPDTSCEPAERRTGEGPATRRVTYWFLPSRTRCLAAAQKCPPPLWLSPPARAHGWCGSWPGWWRASPLCCTPWGHPEWQLREQRRWQRLAVAGTRLGSPHLPHSQRPFGISAATEAAAAVVSASSLPPTRGLSHRFAHLPGHARHVGSEISAAAAAVPAGALEHDTAAYAAGVLEVPSTRRSPGCSRRGASSCAAPSSQDPGHCLPSQQRKNVPR